MNRIIIFSGTTEGRVLSDMLAKDRIKHTVCVASEYGMVVMDENPYADVRVGRMDLSMMEEFLGTECSRDGVVVDATHPYATEVTENIRKCALDLELSCMRVIRDKRNAEGLIYQDMDQVADGLLEALDRGEKVMLTTGSKDLKKFCNKLDDSQKKYVYVRVLPAIECINICLENGIEPGHIIAMQGPFSEETNIALLKQYGIQHLVTKESGTAGGYDEKITAAKQLGITCHIIARPEEEGVHVAEAYSKITGKSVPVEQKKKKTVTLIGRGMGNKATMTLEAAEAIEKADAVFGAERLIRDIRNIKKYQMYRAEDIIPVLTSDDSISNAVVVFSGDSGFYSGATAMKEKLKDIAEVNIICGISSVSYFAAKLGIAYSDAHICSIHGRNDSVNINRTVDNILSNVTTFVLLSGPEDVRTLGERLLNYDGIEITVGINLSYEDECIEKMTAIQALEFERQGIMIGCFKNGKVLRKNVINTFRDDAFIRDKVPMTKECVRHESIIELQLKQGDVVYDIGGGTGSVAIEIAKLDPSLKVYTVEKKPEAVSLIEQNMEKHKADNLTLVKGEAPGALAHLEPCDAVFIGGSSGQLREILDVISYRKSGVRVVINAVSLETIHEINEALKKFEVTDVHMIQLAVTNVNEVGNYHMMQANNPVMIYSFTMK